MKKDWLVFMFIVGVICGVGGYFIGLTNGQHLTDASDIRMTVETDSNSICIIDGNGKAIGSLTREVGEKFQGDRVLLIVQAETK